MTQVVVALPFLSSHDAVSNDARAQVQALNAAGYNAHLYAELFQAGTEKESISTSEFRQFSKHENTIIVLHMCVAWNLMDEVLADARCQVILRYHNITPPQFFDAYDREGAHATRAGLTQMRRVLRLPCVKQLMVNSPYTLLETESTFGPINLETSVVAPFMILPENPLTDQLAPSTELGQDIKRRLKDGRLHVLFVGRWAPNKGHQHLIGVLKSYAELFPSEPSLCLTIAGSISPNFGVYHRDIMSLATRLGVDPFVYVVKGLNEADLTMLYREALALLVCSEHEGFCVPITEAQSLGLPVVALAGTAISDTIGPGQICVKQSSGVKAYDLLAAALHCISKDSALRTQLITTGRRHAAQFSREATAAQFIKSLTALT